jgi:hypothetical protein
VRSISTGPQKRDVPLNTLQILAGTVATLTTVAAAHGAVRPPPAAKLPQYGEYAAIEADIKAISERAYATILTDAATRATAVPDAKLAAVLGGAYEATKDKAPGFGCYDPTNPETCQQVRDGGKGDYWYTRTDFGDSVVFCVKPSALTRYRMCLSIDRHTPAGVQSSGTANGMQRLTTTLVAPNGGTPIQQSIWLVRRSSRLGQRANESKKG